MAVSEEYSVVRLRPVPYYTGTKSLNGIPFRFTVYWNTYQTTWYASMVALTDETLSIKGMALLPGKHLLAPHGYGDFLGELWLEDTSGNSENPTFEGMGDRWELRYYPLIV
jgi:hypothetical protein